MKCATVAQICAPEKIFTIRAGFLQRHHEFLGCISCLGNSKGLQRRFVTEPDNKR